MTSPRDIVRMALGALRGNGLRSALTVLGITVGVFSVIASVTAVAVLEEVLVDNLVSMGSQTIQVTRLPDNREADDDERRRQAVPRQQPQRDADEAAHLAKGHRLQQELNEDVPTLGAQRLPHADLARPLGHADQHDVHHADACGEQRDESHARAAELERAGEPPQPFRQPVAGDDLEVALGLWREATDRA